MPSHDRLSYDTNIMLSRFGVNVVPAFGVGYDIRHRRLLPFRMNWIHIYSGDYSQYHASSFVRVSMQLQK